MPAGYHRAKSRLSRDGVIRDTAIGGLKSSGLRARLAKIGS